MADDEKFDEPRIQPLPVGPERRFNEALERTASLMTSLVAALLVGFVVIAVAGLVVEAYRSLAHDHGLMHAAVAGLDGSFVAIIVLELVHTTLSRGPISRQVQEFLVIGITSAVRSGLETAAARGTANPRDTGIDLLITSVAALLLVVALWLVRQRLNAEKMIEHPRDPRSAPPPADNRRGARFAMGTGERKARSSRHEETKMGKQIKLGNGSDVITYLKEQHEQVKALFGKVLSTEGKEREQAFYDLRRLMAVHEAAEEEIVHPAATRSIPGGEAIVAARLEEEKKAKVALSDLEEMDVDSEEFEENIEELQKDVLAHAKSEETEEFNQLSTALDEPRLQKMRKAVEIAESIAPTRAHPGLESAAANLFAGPFASMVDRTRDALSGKH